MILPSRRLCALAVAVAIAVAAAPSAWPRPIDHFPRSQPADSSSRAAASTAPVRVIHVSPKLGFDWGDAGIGAGAALAVGLIGVGGGVAVRNRRRRARPATTT
jgi:hypothetical protein